ncbi:glycosyltransferase family 2 protein [Saccharicrinis sp. FJH2]|uniref:glycosyltransferase family 2 protein n=1 Tax=Saccharicrinis sp. FJH65 TaxID=3344659 RepID=UPI0035F36215
MISVCLASYNGEKYIREQLISILTQLTPNDEIIISDDHSTDDTLEIVLSLNDPRIKIFINESRLGYVSNFENALIKSKGDIIFLADQDDIWMDDKVVKIIDKLEHFDLVVTDAEVVNAKLETIASSHFELYNVKTGFLLNFLKTRYIGACMAFRRELLEKSLPFPKNKELCAHDYWLACLGELYFRVGLVHEPLLKYRRHQANALTGGEISTNSISKKLKTRLYTLMKLLLRGINL